MSTQEHIPVLYNETIDILNIAEGETVIDATLGAGGHTEAFLKAVGPNGFVFAIETNPTTAKETRKRLQHYKNLHIVEANFKDLATLVEEYRQKYPSLQHIRHIFFDLGVSSMELRDPEVGLSFQVDAPLTMRLDKKTEQDGEVTARSLLSKITQRELEKILREYGDEQYAHWIAKKILEHQQQRPITTTLQLAAIVEDAVPKRGATQRRIHAATKTFQALRIAVNDELENLQRALQAAIMLLEPHGTMAVISFHSLEDRIVKQTFRSFAKDCTCDPEAPVCECNIVPDLKILTKKPITPTKKEIDQNPRARSAKLRAAQKQTV